MPSGLIALLDDVATLAKLAASSIDDVGAATMKASGKAAGVVIDDTAVTPRYVTGLSPERELPIIAKIAWGSIRNKLLIILPVALLLSAFAPVLINVLLLAGGAYLSFEAAEKIIEALRGDDHREEELMEADTPAELEQRQVAGAIRTDFILSAEIMVIALASLEASSFGLRAAALLLVGVLITIAVYGVVALIVKLDDIGLHMCRRENGTTRAIGRGLVHIVPRLLASLSVVGTAAMLWVGGGILIHAVEELGHDTLPHLVHDVAVRAGEALGPLGGAGEWLTGALLSATVGALVGAVLAQLVDFVHRARGTAH
ncbi:DUF808 domain-containing protein [Sphingomonas ginkgonis]|uniref:DUF808 domain-containing protein n=1 Tax=Sphingomonas ginkgonis TaxID=2315330 RepID=A0A429V6G3_9SPHN|nr:DUF808 domain-containing protein [Sphingomonas ginkgonis]RST29529.1 DUF808 domain-containing protein [Sphingomonas ginkgonis]